MGLPSVRCGGSNRRICATVRGCSCMATVEDDRDLLLPTIRAALCRPWRAIPPTPATTTRRLHEVLTAGIGFEASRRAVTRVLRADGMRSLRRPRRRTHRARREPSPEAGMLLQVDGTHDWDAARALRSSALPRASPCAMPASRWPGIATVTLRFCGTIRSLGRSPRSKLATMHRRSWDGHWTN